MAGRGPAPKPEARRRNAPAVAGMTVETDGTPIGPELPDGDWHPLAQDWYDTWRRSAQARAFLDTDWQRLRMALVLVDAYYTSPATSILSEIRLNEAALGATLVDRQRLRMTVTQDEADPAPVVAIASARDRLSDRLR